MRRPVPTRLRRGAAGLAVVIVLVFSQLVIIGVVIAGSRSQDAMAHRVDSVRSFYAAEAGANMSIREIMLGVDEDADGAIGTISDDGNANNDPLLHTARVVATADSSGGQTLVTVKARAGSSRRQVSTAVQPGSTGGSGSGNLTTMCVWSQNSNSTPRWSKYTSGAWGSNTAFPSSIGGEATFVILRPCPTRNEVMLVTEDDQKDVNFCRYNGTAWGSVTEICSDTDQKNDRAVDAVYEALSGDGLIVYWNNSLNKFAYRTWNGSTLSAEATITYSGVSASDYIALYPRPASNQVILVAHVDDGDRSLATNTWDGAAWGSWTLLTDDLQTDNYECFALAYETLSRDALLVYGESGSNSPRYRTWNGTSWSSESSLPAISNRTEWVRLAADPNSDKILSATLDSGNDMEANVWSGSAWGSNTQLESDTGNHDSRRFDIAFEKGTSRAVIVYREKNLKDPRYRVWNGTIWGSELDGPYISGKTERVVVLPGPSTGTLIIGVNDDKNDLHLFQWNGSVMSAENEIETNLGVSSDGCEPFALVAAPEATTPPKVLTWVEEQPQ